MNKNQSVAMKGMVLVALLMTAAMSVGIVASSAFGAAPTHMPKPGGVSEPNTVANQTAKPLETLLNDDGTLNLNSGFTGSLDPTGWSMVAGSKGQPRFVKTGEGHQQAIA